MRRPTTASTSRRLALVLLVPMVFALLGAWQLHRAAGDAAAYGAEAADLTRTAERLAAIAAATPDRQISFADIPVRYRAPDAAAMAERGAGVLRRNALVARARQGMAAGTLLGGVLALGGGAAGLLLARRAGRRALESREALLQGFARVRRRLPLLLGAQAGGMALALCCALVFEAAGAWYLNMADTGLLKLAAGAVLLALGAVWLGWLTLRRLRGILAAEGPAPLPVLGRALGLQDAPALWAFVAELAARQGAPPPQHVVIGLVDGFFVTANDVALSPEDRHLAGRTLHLSAPLLAMLDRDEATAILAHELAHFAGEDPGFGQRFLPVYTALGRGLSAMDGHPASLPYHLLLPATTLGLHLLQAFDGAVSHWSRLRELAADAASASSAGAPAVGRALVRTALIAPVIDAVLDEAVEHPRAAPADLVAAMTERAERSGWDDPHPHLEDRQPHPTDQHPPTLRRLHALGLDADPALLAAAARPARDGEGAFVRTLVPDWPALCATLSDDAAAVLVGNDDAYEAELREQARLPGDAPVEVFEAVRRKLVGYGLIAAALAAAGLFVAYVAMTGRMMGVELRPVLLAISAGLLLAGAMAAVLTWRVRRSGRTPFLLLGAESFRCRGLDRPVPWDAVVQVGVSPGCLTTEFILLPGAPMPRRVRGWRVRVQPRRRRIVLRFHEPRGMGHGEFLDLLLRYRLAAHARTALSARACVARPGDEGSPPARPTA